MTPCFIQISGREMFTFNPDMAVDDAFEEGDEAFDTANLPEDAEEGEDGTVVSLILLTSYLYFNIFL